MIHLDVYNTSYNKKKGWELNWQFDSRPQKVGNRPDLYACRWHVTQRWKALYESYNFASDRISIGGLSAELESHKIVGVQTLAVSRLPLGSHGRKSHLDVGLAERRREYYMGESGGFPRVWALVSLVSPRSPVACLNTKGAPTMY
jgi:hypothetical protein